MKRIIIKPEKAILNQELADMAALPANFRQ
jgi:hypothetical protein